MTVTGYIGAGMVTCGCTALGISISSRLKKRLKLLSSLIGAIDYLQAEVSYGLTPLPELLTGLAERDPSSRELWTRMGWKPGGSFPDEWTHWVSELDLKDCDRAALDEVGGILGRYDADRQASRLGFIKNRLEQSQTDAREELKKNGKLFSFLGFACGIAAVILLM